MLLTMLQVSSFDDVMAFEPDINIHMKAACSLTPNTFPLNKVVKWDVASFAALALNTAPSVTLTPHSFAAFFDGHNELAQCELTIPSTEKMSLLLTLPFSLQAIANHLKWDDAHIAKIREVRADRNRNVERDKWLPITDSEAQLLDVAIRLEREGGYHSIVENTQMLFIAAVIWQNCFAYWNEKAITLESSHSPLQVQSDKRVYAKWCKAHLALMRAFALLGIEHEDWLPREVLQSSDSVSNALMHQVAAWLRRAKVPLGVRNVPLLNKDLLKAWLRHSPFSGN